MGKRNRDAPRGRRQVLQLDRSPVRDAGEAGWRSEQNSSQPPNAWQQVVEATTGDVYYWNTETGETTWERPTELDGNPTSGSHHGEQEVDSVLSQMEQEAEANPARVRAPDAAADDSKPVEPKQAETTNALALMGGYDSDSENEEIAGAESKDAPAQPAEAETQPSTSADAEPANDAPQNEGIKSEEADGEKKPVSFTLAAKPAPKGDLAKARAALKEGSPKDGKEDDKASAEQKAVAEPDADVDDFLKELEAEDVPKEAASEQEQAVMEEGGVGDEGTSAPKALQRSLSPATSEKADMEDREVVQSREGTAETGKEEESDGVSNEEEDRRVMEECFHTVLSLREEGEALVSRLKASVAEEDPTVGGRRDVLLTLLGGMLSWGGCVQELGLLVSQELSGHMSRAALAFLAKLKQRLDKCRAELDKQEASRYEEDLEALPQGWKRMVGSKDGSILYCNESQGVMQSAAPAGTSYKRKPDPSKAAEEARREEEEEHEALIAALPKGEGEQSRESLLLYIQPETECGVDRLHALFPHPPAAVIRIIGSGFVAVSFTSDLECELARDQAMAEQRGVVTDLPSLLEWALLSASSPVVVARCACKSDKIDRYPVTYKRPDPPASTADRSVSPSLSPFLSEHSPSPAVGSSHAGSNPWDNHAADRPEGSAKPMAKAVEKEVGAGEQGKPIKGKLGKKGFSQQLAKWRQKQSELEPDEEEKPVTLKELEEEKKRKAQEWFKDQLEAGANGDVNPNLIPVKRKKL